jgi:HlyD family secretion protein
MNDVSSPRSAVARRLERFGASRVRLAVGGLALLALLGYCAFAGRTEEASAYRTVPVERGELVAKVSASGSLSALVTVEVGSQVTGRIQSLHADFNSAVKRGQLIAKIDPALFDAAVAQARANVAAASGNLARLRVQADDAARQAERARQLFEQKLVSENDRDEAVTAARAAEAAVAQGQGQLEQARSALRQAETNLLYTDIRAPTDGIVISRAVNVGQTVAASLSAPVIFTIAQDLRAMEVHTNVAESDIGRLQAGMPATFTVDAYPGETFSGSIREIRNAPQVVQSVVTYDAVIDVSNADLRLKPGMTASVTIVTERRENALSVPNAALRFTPRDTGDAAPTRPGASRPPAGRRAEGTVWVLRGKEPRPVAARLGLNDGSHTEITGGELREGDLVIAGLAVEAAPSNRGGRGFRLL